jgi:hypothetical protein
MFKGKIFHPNIFPMSGVENEDEEENIAGIHGALEYYKMLKANPATGEVDMNAVNAVYSQMDNMPRSKTGGLLQWTEMGPDNVGGRCRAIVFDRYNNNIVYSGGVSGGTWRSLNGGATWQYFGNSDASNIIVTSMCQAANGALYYGTGEQDLARYGNGSGNSAFAGRGIYKMSKGTNQWVQLAPTDPGISPVGSVWNNVNKLVADPTDGGRIYAANDGGLYISADSGATWKKSSITYSGKGKDIALSNDGKTIYAALASGDNTIHYLFRSDDQGQTFKKLTGISSSACNYQIALSPQNNNVVYLITADPATLGLGYIYKSTDKGETWTTIGKGDAVFNPFAAQGDYDACIAVDPTNQDRVVIGGLDLWQGKLVDGSYQWTQLTNWNAEFLDNANTIRNTHYVHADQHILTFDKANNLYIGSDGGISKSTDFTYNTQPTFFNDDYGFNTVQFYGMGISATDKLEVIAGAQDNGVIKVNKNGITLLNGSDIKEGDGGFCEISKINPNVYFAEYVYGDVSRSFSKGLGSKPWTSFYDTHVPTKGGSHYPFVAIFSLWENMNDTTSQDSVIYSDPDNNHSAGEIVTVRSKNGVDFGYKLTSDLPKGTLITVQDKIQSKFYLGAYNGIWMTRSALDGSTTPEWFQISSIPGFAPHDIEYTPDGDGVYVAGTNGSGGALYLITGLRGKTLKYASNGSFNPAAWGIVTKKIFSSSNQAVTGVAVDEKDVNHVIVVLGTYGQPNHVYHSYNAASASPTFSLIQGKLPPFPVYDALINTNDPKNYFLGTEFGVWSSTNSGSAWTQELNGMEQVPVFQLRQRRFETTTWNGPTIYACTHGRGVFMSETLATGIKDQDNTKVASAVLNMYPNPAQAYTILQLNLDDASDVQIRIFDLQGKEISSLSYGRQMAGDHTFKLETGDLKRGTYLVSVKTNAGQTTSKLLIMN